MTEGMKGSLLLFCEEGEGDIAAGLLTLEMMWIALTMLLVPLLGVVIIMCLCTLLDLCWGAVGPAVCVQRHEIFGCLGQGVVVVVVLVVELETCRVHGPFLAFL